MWIDTNGCEETMHVFKTVEGTVECLHADDSICIEAEYDVSEIEEAA